MFSNMSLEIRRPDPEDKICLELTTVVDVFFDDFSSVSLKETESAVNWTFVPQLGQNLAVGASFSPHSEQNSGRFICGLALFLSGRSPMNSATV